MSKLEKLQYTANAVDDDKQAIKQNAGNMYIIILDVFCVCFSCSVNCSPFFGLGCESSELSIMSPPVIMGQINQPFVYPGYISISGAVKLLYVAIALSLAINCHVLTTSPLTTELVCIAIPSSSNTFIASGCSTKYKRLAIFFVARNVYAFESTGISALSASHMLHTQRNLKFVNISFAASISVFAVSKSSIICSDAQ